MQTKQMNVSIEKKRYETAIQGRISSGKYGTASEVVRAGLNALDEKDAKESAIRELNAIFEESRASGDVNKTVRQMTDEWLVSKGLL